MACQNIKTLKINQGTGLLQNRLYVSGQFWFVIKQKEMLIQQKGKSKKEKVKSRL
jgi:hypothetical protein